MVNIDISYLKLPERAQVKYVWITSNGIRTKIVDMDLNHIMNLLNCFKGKSTNFYFNPNQYYHGFRGTEWIKELEKEKAYRIKMMSSLK